MSFIFLLGMLPTIAQSTFAQGPLNFGNNFFVTGDYVVAGAYGMTSKFTTINGVSYAIGTISVPDSKNMGIQGATQVPKGAQIVAALLYWQSVEKVGAPGTGQNGFFRPVFNGGPAAPGYAISGTNISGSNTVSWSSGGCSGGSTGKMLRTYRADVAGGMPADATGNTIANGTFEVRLPSVGNSTPITLGATLVVIYRLPSGVGGPGAPLNSIVIYDGDYSQSNAQLIMTQPLQGFYDADHNPVSRLTHIVGGGQSNKFQTVYLGSDPNKPLALPLLYGNKLPAFPGWYGTWDNPTWTFTNASTTSPGLLEDASSATTQVVPASMNQGCVSWGAVIVSTTVKNTDGDGILNSWKKNQGYCDAALNNGKCGGLGDPAWVDLSGAASGHKDMFLQYDYMCSTVLGPPSLGPKNSCQLPDGNGNHPLDYSFDPRLAVDPVDSKTAVDKVVDAFDSHKGSAGAEPFVLHVMPGNAILESQASVTCADTDPTCPFPNEAGTVGFREGLAYIKNQTIEPGTGLLGCDPTTDVNPCVAVFPHAKKDSYHYALFSHGVGLPNWFLSDGSISSVSQTGSTVTFTTSSPHGISPIAGDSLCSAANGYIGRVTVVFAITNQNLNGTFCAKAVGNPPALNKFSISLTNSSTTATYTPQTDPNLAVANGQVTSMSGYSDVGGQNSVISLGYGGWGPPNDPASEGNKWNVKAGTFMHEFGHTLGLTHGGTFYNAYNPQAAPPNNDYTPTYEVNCKPNAQTVMSYVFQFDLLQADGPANQPPLKVLDFSRDPDPLTPTTIPTLTENQPGMPDLTGLSYPYTSWFQLTSYSGAGAASGHCNGTAIPANAPSYSYNNDLVGNFFWSAATGTDINFNGNASDLPMHPHNEWEGTPAANGAGLSPGVDLQQVSAVGTISTIGPGGEAGGLKPAGGGGGLKPAGGGGGLQPAGGGGGLKPAGGGGGLKPAGGGGLSAEINHGQANSYARPPQNLFIKEEEVSPRFIDLGWFAPSFGAVVQYNIYRSDAGAPFAQIDHVPGNQTTYQDKTASCNPGGYRYRVTAIVNNDLGQPMESTHSNTVPASGQNALTGCYVITNFPSPANAVQGSIVPVSWTLTDDFYATPPADWGTAVAGHAVTNLAASTLVANGPLPGNCTTSGATTLLLKGTPTAVSGASTFTTNNLGQFTFNWDTDAFCAGSYTFTLKLDSTQAQTTTSLTQLAIDINDTDSTPHITTLSVPDATVDVSYSNTLSEEGGVGSVTWSLASGSLPAGVTLSASGVLQGTPLVPPPGQLNFVGQTYNFTAQVTDSATPMPNTGTQAFTLRLITPVSFKSNTFATATTPQAVVTADFNNDGKLDLAIPNYGNNTVSILLGNGDGTFTPQSPVATGNGPYSLATANFGNGQVDLVVTNFNDATVSVFLGNGDGTFRAPVVYPVGNTPSSVRTGDFNGDGALDLAVANQNDHSVSILLGNGDGTFQAAVAYPAGTTDVATVAVGDFNGDGVPDLAVTNPSSDTVSVLLNNGNGTFGAPVAYSTGAAQAHPIAVSAVDLNGDGKLDLAVTNLNADTVAILLGKGDGTFNPQVSYPSTISALPDGPDAIATGDFNGDGKMDLAIANQGINTVSILLGNGDGTLQSPLEFSTGKLAVGVAAGDFNGDGRLDLAVANHDDNTVSVMLHLPQPPTNLAVSSVTTTSVTLGWTASASNVAGYNVYRSTTPGGPYDSPTFVASPGYTDNTVTHGTTHYYVVTAVGTFSLESVKSNEVSAAP